MAKTNIGDYLAETLGKVSESDTGRDQIEYIDIDMIDDDPNNFYAIDGIGELADNIALCGLQQPLRVRSAEGGRFVIVSGHRRRAAIRKLVDEDGRADLREIPCIRERSEASPAMRELQLIMANSDTRKMTSADIGRQLERVEALLYQLKGEGVEFPGRMRAHVAEVCKVSETKIATVKTITAGLASCWRPAYDKGDLSESTALTLARMPEHHQAVLFGGWETKKNNIRYLYDSAAQRYAQKMASVQPIKCPLDKTAHCNHIDEKLAHICAKADDYSSTTPCARCCNVCDKLASCSSACPKLAEKVKQLRSDQRAARQQKKDAQAAKDAPTIRAIEGYWQRFGEARAASGKTVKQCLDAMGIYYSKTDDETFAQKERGEKITTSMHLPYGYCCNLSDVKYLVAAADLFGVSLDYLLCRTADPAPTSTHTEDMTPLAWLPGKDKPHLPCRAACVFDCDGTRLSKLAYWDGLVWRFARGGACIDAECVKWCPLPEDEEDAT